jgi:DNA-binding response OmpR family regulator
MKQKSHIRVLIVEDSPSDLILVRELFADVPEVDFDIEHASRLADALRFLKEKQFDVVLLDLGLPDSQGVDTFTKLHREAPNVPILVLTSLDDDTAGVKTIEGGAEDFLVKREAQAALLRNSVRYAVLRANVRRTQEENRQREEQSREIESMDKLSLSPATGVTARIYSGGPLHDNAPAEFKAAVAEYFDLLGLAMEQRIFKVDSDCSGRLRELGLQLGFLRSGPRDVIEIHTTALRKQFEKVSAPKAQAFMEEGRIMLLELMGNLISYYRSFYSTTKREE